MKIGLVTCQEFKDLAEDERPLVGELASKGVEAVPWVWTDGPPAPGRFDALILRSTWDYHLHLPEFLNWVEQTAATTRLFNPAPIVRWNCHKSYLLDLRDLGVPIVPTVKGSEVHSLARLMDEAGWSRVVLKPAVSANAHKTHLVSRREAEATGEGLLQRLRKDGEVLVQPYLPAVESPGEHSLVHFAGKFSHAVLKRPALAPGNRIREGTRVEPSAAELHVARQALRAAPEPPLYARVDLVADAEGQPRVMELELIEPSLFLLSEPAAAGHFAAAILGRLRS